MGHATNLRYCLAHGLVTLHLRTEEEERSLPAALYNGAIGEEALLLAGPRVRRVARWDAAGWDTWWQLIARLAGGRPAVAALPPLEGGGELPPSLPTVYLVPPSVAVRAASDLREGVALYLGAWTWEVATFGPAGMGEPARFPPGLEPLYRAVIAERFRAEGRPWLPQQVPALLQQGLSVEVAGLLEGIVPLLGSRPAALGGEDGAAVAAVAAALRGQGHQVAVVDPLAGLERLVWAVGGLA